MAGNIQPHSHGTGEASKDRLSGEEPDEAADDPTAAECPLGVVKIPTSRDKHGSRRAVEVSQRESNPQNWIQSDGGGTVPVPPYLRGDI